MTEQKTSMTVLWVLWGVAFVWTAAHAWAAPTGALPNTGPFLTMLHQAITVDFAQVAFAGGTLVCGVKAYRHGLDGFGDVGSKVAIGGACLGGATTFAQQFGIAGALI